MQIGDLFRLAIEQDASDILVTAGSSPSLRVAGQLVRVDTPPLSRDEVRDLTYSVLRAEQIAQFEQEFELDFSLAIGDGRRARGNAYFQRGTVAAAFRLIPAQIPTMEKLLLPRVVGELALASQGLVVVSGPTGHGKSTTLAAMIDIINTHRRVHIITMEDPIEYIHTNRQSVIDQREVGFDTKSFARALRHVLREDPDVILVGEMRDLETISAALTAAETGHLVLATLHTNDAVQSVDRLIDVFPPHQQEQIRIQLGFCLLAVIAQRLLPRKDGNGRIVATEIMRNVFAVANLIRERQTHQIYAMMETHAREGMHTFDANLHELYRKGLISREVAASFMRSPRLLDRSAGDKH